ncbi:MAG: FMN-binding protein [Desulfobacterales bacterium]|nr:FMN-binding protein [Desulfobacterales bacterium]MCF8079919.1 FMN-binding protein [Desulfobacterales bacterium]
MSNAARTFIFAGLLCLVCSLLLTAAATGLKSFQERNVEVDRQKNILRAVGAVDPESRATPEEIESIYEKKIRRIWVDSAGRIVSEAERSKSDLPLYVYQEADRILAYVVPINTRGLWGPIHGYLAIEDDGSTIRGFAVYQHQETPGLGGEIEKRWFQENFKGKKIVNQNGKFVSVAVAKGEVKEVVPPEKRRNYVDGISGATMTGKFLSEGLADILAEYEPVSVCFRKNSPELTP